MGFTTGFLGGFTLTASLAYISVQLHARNRAYQSALLQQQSIILRNIVEPQPPMPTPTSRTVQAGVWESAKDRWNAELESNVRKLQNTDWDRVNQQFEEGVVSVWKRIFAKGKEVVQEVQK